jgi:hypothetical protein
MAVRKRSKLESGNSPLNHRMVLHLFRAKIRFSLFGKNGCFIVLFPNQVKSVIKTIGIHFARSNGTALAKTMLDHERMRRFVAVPAGFGKSRLTVLRI